MRLVVLPTAGEAIAYRSMVFSWISELHEKEQLTPQIISVFNIIDDLLLEEIRTHNCDFNERLKMPELSERAVEIFWTLCAWTHDAFPDRVQKYKKSLN